MRWRTGLLLGASVLAGALGAWWWLNLEHLDPQEFDISIDRYSIESSKVGDTLDQVAVRVRSGEPAGLVVILHGRGRTPEGMLSDELFAALQDRGHDAPVVVFPHGGESSYWHDRESGDWASYVTDEVIPEAIERYDIPPDRVALGGMSMGGYGALEIALHDPQSFCAAAGHSPAIFPDWESSAAGAFDSADDFAAHDLLRDVEGAGAEAFEGMPVWVDIGRDDPFLDATTRFTETLEENHPVGGGVFDGAHDEAYWWSHMDDYIDFYATELEKC
jgi:S-formylglutathione hydrolase FrmB